MVRYGFSFSLHARVQIIDAVLSNGTLIEGVVKHVGMDLGGEHYLVEWYDFAKVQQQRWFRAAELAQMLTPDKGDPE